MAAALVLAVVLRAGGVRQSARDLPQVPAPQRPVLFFNPKSGGGKAESFKVADEARARGIEPIELGPAVGPRAARARRRRRRRRRAGDGRRRRLAGRRRRDRRGARSPLRLHPRGHAQPLRARPRRRSRRRRRRARRVRRRRRAPRRPRRGQRPRVRQQRLARPLRRRGPARRLPRREAADHPRHRAGSARTRGHRARPALDGTRRPQARLRRRDPRLQQPLPAGPRGRLGHPPADRRRAARHHGRWGRPPAAANGRRPQRPWREWTTPAFEVEADHPVPAGIDGEAVQLQPPLRFRIRPGVLRVRIARQHPGASPSASLPEGLGQSASRTGPDRRSDRDTLRTHDKRSS